MDNHSKNVFFYLHRLPTLRYALALLSKNITLFLLYFLGGITMRIDFCSKTTNCGLIQNLPTVNGWSAKEARDMIQKSRLSLLNHLYDL